MQHSIVGSEESGFLLYFSLGDRICVKLAIGKEGFFYVCFGHLCMGEFGKKIRETSNTAHSMYNLRDSILFILIN
jgi:hypothetical protein